MIDKSHELPVVRQQHRMQGIAQFALGPAAIHAMM